MRGALAAARRACLCALRLCRAVSVAGAGGGQRAVAGAGRTASLARLASAANLIEYSCGACGAYMVQNVRVGHMLLLCVFLIFFERGRSVWFTFCILVCLRA